MLIAGKICIGLALLIAFIWLLVAFPKVRSFFLSILVSCWFIILILLVLFIFKNNWFLLICNNATKIGLFFMCLGIIGMATSGGRKMAVTGAIIALLSYFILPTF